MKQILLFVLLACPMVYGQETKFTLKKGSDYWEEYYVLLSNEKTKHGTYVKYKRPNTGLSAFDNSIDIGVQLVEVGNYTKGERTGIWEKYYDAPFDIFRQNKEVNKLKERGLYVGGKKNGLWIYYYPDTAANSLLIKKFGIKKVDSINVQIEQSRLKPKLAGRYINDKRVSEWVAYGRNGSILQKYDFTSAKLIKEVSLKDSTNFNFKREPIFIGSEVNLNDYIWSGFTHNYGPFGSIQRSKSTVVVEFVIDKAGHVVDPLVTESKGSRKMEAAAITTILSLDNNWLPALDNGTPIDYKYRIAFDIDREVDLNEHTRFKFNYRIISKMVDLDNK